MPPPEVQVQNIYATRPRPQGAPPPPPIDLTLTQARSLTRNRIVAASVLMATGLTLAIYLATLIDRADGLRGRPEEQEAFTPEKIRLQEDGVGYTGRFPLDEKEQPIAITGINVDRIFTPRFAGDTNLTGGATAPTASVGEALELPDGEDLPSMLVSVAAKFIKAGDYEEAALNLRKALAKRPDDLDALRLLGTVLLLQEKHAEAAELFTELAKRDPFKPDIFNHLGVACIRLGDLDRAREALGQALKLNHTYPDARQNLALLHLMRAEYDKVPPLLAPMVTVDPNNPKLRRYLANAYFESGDPYQARVHLQELARIEPAVGRTYFEVARCYAMQELTQEAMAWITLGRDKVTAEERREFLRDPAFEILYPLQSFQREFGAELPAKAAGRT